MKRIAVLMSTYNGEKYLCEQIDSILTQDGIEVTLYIRDDGSTDKTVDIINHYTERYNNIILHKGENVGVGNSFMQLIYETPGDYDYYAFSDQDDVWLPEKLLRGVEVISEEKRAALYCSNQTIVDKNLNYICMRFKNIPEINYIQVLCHNLATGCTMIWNNELNKLLKDPKRHPDPALLKNRIHDVWVAMVACVVGNIYLDINSYINYRQHENNVVGAKEKTVLNSMAEKYKKLVNTNERNGRSYLAREICGKYGEFISEQKILIDSASYSRRKLLGDVKEIINYSGETSIGLVIKILIGLY